MNRKVMTAILSTVLLFAVLVTANSYTSSAHKVVSATNAKGLSLEKATSTTVEQKPVTLMVNRETIHLDELVPPAPMAVTGNRQGGDDISSATVIASMPFSDVGTTVGYADDYEEDACLLASGPGNPDVVYSYTPAVNELVTIELCNSAFFTNLWVYRTTADTLVECNRFNSTLCSTPRSGLLDLPMDSAITYYIIIDGDPALNPDEGDYEINCSSYPAPFVNDSSAIHPAIADAGNGWMMIGYEDQVIDTNLIWAGSNDDGGTYPEVGSFTAAGQFTYPSLDYHGSDSVFFGTLVPNALENSGASTYLFRVPNPIDGLSWGLSSWGWESFGWHDMLMADIACDGDVEFVQQPGEYKFGILSMVHSTTYTTPAMVNAPHIFYEIDTTIVGRATISWYPDFDGCQSTTCDIDKITKFSYAAYDQWVDSISQWTLLIRRDLFADFNDDTNAGMVQHILASGEHSEHPAIAAHDGNILVAAEYSTDAAPADHDIICWYTSGSDYENMTTSVVISTGDDERFPEISHVSGDTYVVSYIVNDELYMILSEDAGATWGTPTLMSGSDVVVSEYRSADIADRGTKIMYEYQPGLPADPSIFVRIVPTGLILDSDGDGVDDDNDNCPAISNPLQEDADGDGIGDVCDDCTDVDGDGFGDPGYAANTCTDDNCPTIANPLQEDADGDNIGDVCDDCTDTDGDGYGNPGYAANTCADDNCPDDANPGQEDTDGDGVGDACCCIGFRGNIDGLDGEGPVITDLTYLVDYLFAGGAVPPCPLEADIDGADGSIPVITDLTYLVDFLFGGGPAPVNCP
ncbi:MAG: thrombospondin type 3 repeat-containing protein [bacterium]|nr:thrombospondin type 3 repeat-containing protein [bacterium]